MNLTGLAGECVACALDTKRIRSELTQHKAGEEPVDVASDLGAPVDNAAVVLVIDGVGGIEANLLSAVKALRSEDGQYQRSFDLFKWECGIESVPAHIIRHGCSPWVLATSVSLLLTYRLG
jgi:hypothetical protein